MCIDKLTTFKVGYGESNADYSYGRHRHNANSRTLPLSRGNKRGPKKVQNALSRGRIKKGGGYNS
jgi:hypothetical protein